MNYLEKSLSIKISTFYLLLLNIFMFIVVSNFGQTFLFGTNLSFIFSAMSFTLFLISFNRIPLKISTTYVVLILYSFAITIIGLDFYYWAISLFTLSSVFLFAIIRIKEIDYSKLFFVSSLFSLVLLFFYTNMGFLGNWNPNSMGVFTTYGLLGFIIPWFITRSKKRKIFYFIFILLSIYLIYLTDSRNNIVIYLIAILSIFSHNVIKRRLLFRFYYSIAFLSPFIVGKVVPFITQSTYYDLLLEFSYKYFGKASITSGREQFWLYIERLIGSDWLLGTGKSLYNIIYPHNLFYSVQYFFGTIGYILFLVFLIVIIEFIYKYAHQDKISIGCILLFIAIFFGQVAENVLFTSDTAVYLPYVYLSVGLFRAKYLKDKKFKVLSVDE